MAARDAAALRAIPLRNSEDRILSLEGLLEHRRRPRAAPASRSRAPGAATSTTSAHRRDRSSPITGRVAVMSFDPDCVAAFRDVARLAAAWADRGALRRTSDYWSELSAGQRFAMRHLLTAAIARPNFIAYDIRALPALGAGDRAQPVRSAAPHLDGAQRGGKARAPLCRRHDLRRDRALRAIAMGDIEQRSQRDARRRRATCARARASPMCLRPSGTPAPAARIRAAIEAPSQPVHLPCLSARAGRERIGDARDRLAAAASPPGGRRRRHCRLHALLSQIPLLWRICLRPWLGRRL